MLSSDCSASIGSVIWVAYETFLCKCSSFRYQPSTQLSVGSTGVFVVPLFFVTVSN